MNIRRLMLPGILIVLVAAVVVYAQASGDDGGLAGWLKTSPPTPAPQVAVLAEGPKEVVTASGTLLPARWARLGFPMGGRVAEVLVAEGQAVEAGQVLVRLESAELATAVRQAQAALDGARAELARLEAGATAEEIAAAEAQVRAAEAELARLQAGARPEEIAAAEAVVRAAEAELARLKAGPKPEEIAAAKAAKEKAAAVMRAAQAAYDKVAWMPDAGASPQAVALEQATADYEAAKAAYEALVRGATAEEIAAAQARVDQARAQLALLKAGAMPQEVAAAQARVDQARAQLARLRAGATPEELAAARARVETAEAALEQARARLEQATLRAPFAGTVARLDVRVGEVVMPGRPVLILGDLSTLQVETDDLSEEDVAQVQIGAPVTVTLDALPDRTFRGQVIAIAPMASVDQGGTNYKVTVALEERDPAMRWGMTAYVEVSVNP